MHTFSSSFSKKKVISLLFTTSLASPLHSRHVRRMALELAIRYRAAKVEWDVLLQKGQDEPSWSVTLPSPSVTPFCLHPAPPPSPPSPFSLLYTFARNLWTPFVSLLSAIHVDMYVRFALAMMRTFSRPGGKTPKHIVRANTLRKPSSSRVFQFFDYFFGAKHAVPQPTRIHSLLSGRVRSGTYHGRSGQPVGATASPRKPRASSLQPTRRRNNAPMP